MLKLSLKKIGVASIAGLIFGATSVYAADFNFTFAHVLTNGRRKKGRVEMSQAASVAYRKREGI